MSLDAWLDELLAQNQGTQPPPNYFGFTHCVFEALSDGTPPRSFCEVFAEKVSHYARRMESHSEKRKAGLQVEMAEFTSDFHRFKLLNSCASRLPVEMRRLIAELAQFDVMGT